jgi:Anti-sigma factor NepR
MDGADLKAICSGIGVELRKLFTNVLSEPIPDGMAELLGQLDRPTTQPSDVHDDEAARR